MNRAVCGRPLFVALAIVSMILFIAGTGAAKEQQLAGVHLNDHAVDLLDLYGPPDGVITGPAGDPFAELRARQAAALAPPGMAGAGMMPGAGIPGAPGMVPGAGMPGMPGMAGPRQCLLVLCRVHQPKVGQVPFPKFPELFLARRGCLGCRGQQRPGKCSLRLYPTGRCQYILTLRPVR